MIFANFVLAGGPGIGLMGAAYLYNQQQGAIRQANRPQRKNLYDATAFAEKQKQSFSQTHHMLDINNLENASPVKPDFSKPQSQSKTQNTLLVPDDINSSSTLATGIYVFYAVSSFI